MSIKFQIEMVVLALTFVWITMHLVRQNEGEVRQMKTWLALAVGMVVIAIFPEIPWYFAHILRFEQLSNFLILMAVLVLLVLALMQHIKLIKHESEMKELVQQISILKSVIMNKKNNE